jgi:hypothetical protein
VDVEMRGLLCGRRAHPAIMARGVDANRLPDRPPRSDPRVLRNPSLSSNAARRRRSAPAPR